MTILRSALASVDSEKTSKVSKSVSFNDDIIIHEVPSCNKEAHLRYVLQMRQQQHFHEVRPSLSLSTHTTLHGKRLVKLQTTTTPLIETIESPCDPVSLVVLAFWV